MRQAIPAMAAIVKKLIAKEEVTEGYVPKGLRRNYFATERGSSRAVKLLLKKVAGEPFETEYPMPVFDRVDPQPAIADIRSAKIALVSSGGPVPKGNPDRIESSSASKYGKYSLKDITDFTPSTAKPPTAVTTPCTPTWTWTACFPWTWSRSWWPRARSALCTNIGMPPSGNGTSVANAKAFAAANR